MHFSTEAVPGEIPAYMDRFVAITGWRPWKRRLAWLQEQVRANPTMSFFLTERFETELAFEQARRHRNQTGRYPWPPETDGQQRLYSVLAMITRCHQRLNPAGKTRLKGMIEDALKSDYGFAHLAFEMKIAAHLMTKGFDVNFHDMEESGGFDYLVRNDGVAIEVECKFVSGDIGRQIHLQKFHQLGTVLLPEMNKFLNQNDGGHLIRISIPERLTGDIKQHREIRDLMLQAFSDQDLGANSGKYKVSISGFSVTDSPFGRLPLDQISMNHIERFLSEEFEIDNKHVLFGFSPKKRAVLVVVESVKKDAVLKGIHRQLKGAARSQLSGDQPGIFCCELGDVTEDQLRALGNDRNEGTGLQYMVLDLFARRPQIHTLAFSTPGTVRMGKTTSGTSTHNWVQESGPVWTFKNPSHPLRDDPRCDIY